MQKSAIGMSNNNNVNAKGFTLIEILVVIFIIGIILTLVALKLNPDMGMRRGLPHTANQLFYNLRLAQEQAILQGAEIGLSASPTQIAFLLYNPSGIEAWKLITNQRWLRQINLPANIQLSINSRMKNIPQVVFYSSGEITPFVIELSQANNNTRFIITGQQNGNIEIDSR